MYSYTLETHDHHHTEEPPSWGAIILTGMAAAGILVTITVVVTYPSFGVGALVGMVASVAVRTVRRIGRRGD
ncbi:MAG: hypothetical protein ABEH65_00030 [Halobacteriales archaeon]